MIPNYLVTFDCETITDASKFEPIDHDAIAASILPPKNYKKQETIDKWNLEEKPALVDAAVAEIVEKQNRGGLSAETGILLSFTYAIGADAPTCVTGDEKSILVAALEVLAYNPMNVYVTFNGVGFDLPFIRQRCWVHGLKVPNKPFRSKPWDDNIQDLMLLWSADRDRRISLDRLCKVLGVVSPKASGFSGADVWPAYQRGEIERIREYALQDVIATRACWQRMQ